MSKALDDEVTEEFALKSRHPMVAAYRAEMLCKTGMRNPSMRNLRRRPHLLPADHTDCMRQLLAATKLVHQPEITQAVKRRRELVPFGNFFNERLWQRTVRALRIPVSFANF